MEVLAMATTKTKKPVELLLENGDYFRTVALDYRDGERYPVLEHDGGRYDLLGAICRPVTAGK